MWGAELSHGSGWAAFACQASPCGRHMPGGCPGQRPGPVSVQVAVRPVGESSSPLFVIHNGKESGGASHSACTGLREGKVAFGIIHDAQCHLRARKQARL